MEVDTKDNGGFLFPVLSLLVAAAFTAGCAAPQVTAPGVPSHKVLSDESAPPQVYDRIFRDFAAVITREGDTLAQLASKYLNDPSKGWLIAEFNGIDTIGPGQELIVPLRPFKRAGVTSEGYQTVPVLVYHRFSPTKEKNKMTVPEEVFEGQMKLLKDRGYRVITMDQLFDFLDYKAEIPEKSVVITIDDGWRSAYDIAFPILKKYGYPATLFLYTDLITGSKKTLSWDLLREMAEYGFDMQCHTITHRKLALMEEKESFKDYFDALNRELSGASRLVRKELGRDCKYLAYPYGYSNDLVAALLKKHGYRGAFTVERGSNPFFVNNYLIKRSTIFGTYDLKEFEKNLMVFTDRMLK